MIERVGRAHPGLRAGLAIVAGIVTALGFEPFAWWPLLFFGVAGFSLVVLGAGGLRQALLLGFCYGLGYMGLGLNWMRAIFLDALVGIVLVTSLLYVLLAALMFAMRRLALWPVGAATAWVAVEALISRWPFDGFGWMRLGYTMTDAPLAGLYPLIGVAGVTFVIALIGQGLVWLADGAVAARVETRRRIVTAVIGLIVITLGAGAGLLVPPGAATAETSTIGWVQGGAPGGGVYGIGPPRTTTANHLAETTALFGRIDRGELPRPDFVVWPENGTDLDPHHDAETAEMVRQSLEVAGMPILVGTILSGPGLDERQTASLWLDPVQGELERYVKRGIVPFGEFVPFRDILLPLIPKLSYVGAQSIPGTEPGVITARTAAGEFPLGVLVCYDVSFDHIVYDTVRYGGQVLVVQSSNAMYQGTGQIDQQFAMTRARAAELRREVLVVTTSGVSGLIRADGSIEFSVSDPGPA
ncbi:MAG: apolipoprotein N-acyltransferase, partial [Propionibacteriaceae bacterium]|nr:apolipoprotein N-acyltransferase [Propionibacteriaceae bacterium]